MKKESHKLLAIVVAISLMILSTERTSGQTFGIEAWNTFLSGYMFTPQQNVSLSDISLQINGFTDYTFPSSGGTIDLYLASDVTSINPSAPFHEPYSTIAGATAPINDTSGPTYKFELPATLQANTPYWLWIYMQSPDGYNDVYASWNGVDAIQGIANAYSVDLVINGSEDGANGWIPQSYTTLTAVPEPRWYGPLAGALVLTGFFCNTTRRRLLSDQIIKTKTQ